MPNQDPHTILTDEELALEAQGGDLSAFDEIVRRHESSIFRFLAARTNKTEAEDLTQQVFVRAYRKIHLYRCRYRFLPWLFTIARRESIQYYRNKKSETELESEVIDHRLPSDPIEQSDAHEALWETIREVLSEVSAAAFWLRHEEGLTIAEIATVLKLTQVHVKVLLHRARKKLADHLHRDSSLESPEPSTSHAPSHV